MSVCVPREGSRSVLLLKKVKDQKHHTSKEAVKNSLEIRRCNIRKSTKYDATLIVCLRP